MSISYRFNLASSGASTKDYPLIAQRALRAAREASAVDTGAFKKGWTVGLAGDYLILSNRVRYAAPVELGSVVHKHHQFKVRDAVTELLKVKTPTMEVAGVPVATASTVRPSAPKSLITEQEIRSPALILKRGKEKKGILSNLFKISFLAGLLAQKAGEQNEQSQ